MRAGRNRRQPADEAHSLGHRRVGRNLIVAAFARRFKRSHIDTHLAVLREIDGLDGPEDAVLKDG